MKPKIYLHKIIHEWKQILFFLFKLNYYVFCSICIKESEIKHILNTDITFTSSFHTTRHSKKGQTRTNPHLFVQKRIHIHYNS